MNILTSNGKRLINYNNVTSLSTYKTTGGEWRMTADLPHGSYLLLGTFYTEEECKNTFDRLCDKIAKCREHDIIDLGDLWD